MIDLKKIGDFTDLTSLPMVHVIGCGAIGSWIAMQLVRQGVMNITLWDDDVVSAHNITNQYFYHLDVGVAKVVCLHEQLNAINPEAKVIVRQMKYESQPLTGYVFLCVDSIETRLRIATQHHHNVMVKAMFDCRMGLTDAQHYAANWSDRKQRERFMGTMQFKDSEVQRTSACGTTLSVLPTVLNITSTAVANFMNLVRGEEIKNEVHIDSYIFTTNWY